MEGTGRVVYRYIVKSKGSDGELRTVRAFRTNDGEFALRVIKRTRELHGTALVSRKVSSSPMHPFLGSKP